MVLSITFPASLPGAKDTAAPAVGINPKILAFVWMALRAVGLIGVLRRYAGTSQNVHGVRCGLQVIGVDASTMRTRLSGCTGGSVAKMIEWKSFRDWSLEFLVRNTVGFLILAHHFYDAVVVLVEVALPQPAVGNRIDLNVLQELFFGRHAAARPSIFHSLFAFFGELSSWHNPLFSLSIEMASPRGTV